MSEKQAKYSQGPWDFEVHPDEASILCPGNVTPWRMATVVAPDEERLEANARLIAAACNSYGKHCQERAVECAESDLLGELLEALESLVDAWVDNHGHHEQRRGECEDAGHRAGIDLTCPYCMARASIAKAKGTQ